MARKNPVGANVRQQMPFPEPGTGGERQSSGKHIYWKSKNIVKNINAAFIVSEEEKQDTTVSLRTGSIDSPALWLPQGHRGPGPETGR